MVSETLYSLIYVSVLIDLFFIIIQSSYENTYHSEQKINRRPIYQSQSKQLLTLQATT